jgi:hypothetical protein
MAGEVVPQTSKSAVSQVSKPADRPAFGRATHCHALPIWKSAIQQVWKPAVRGVHGEGRGELLPDPPLSLAEVCPSPTAVGAGARLARRLVGHT